MRDRFDDGKKLHKLVGDKRRPRVSLPPMTVAIRTKEHKPKSKG